MSHNLTLEQEKARGELMAHLAKKPKGHDAFDLAAWTDRRAVLERAYNDLIQGKPAPTPKPLPPDEPRREKPASDRFDPQARLNRMMAQFHATTGKAKANFKARAKALVREHGLPMPPELEVELPKGPAAHKPKPTPPPPPRDPEAAEFGASLDREARRAKPLDDVRTLIATIRARTWSLLAVLEELTPEQLAVLEELTPEQLAVLEPDLGMLDEAAHITTRLAQRRAA